MNRNTSKTNTGSWVYINGELYHAGVKGMKWGKHLPGTDWWKKLSGEFRRGLTSYDNEQRRANTGTKYVGYQRTPTSHIYSGHRDESAARSNGFYSGRDANIYNYSKQGRAKAYATVAGRMAKRRLDKAGKAVSAGAKKVSEFSKRTVSSLKDKAIAGKAKAKQLLSSFSKKSVSSIKSTASRVQSKVYNFLGKLGILERVYNNRRSGGAGSQFNQIYTKK